LETLKITEEDILEEKTEYTNKMLVAPVPATVQNKQTVMPKSIVLNLGWFDRDRIKFEDW